MIILDKRLVAITEEDVFVWAREKLLLMGYTDTDIVQVNL